jgi:uncharacterized protein (TIGR00106 family)
MARLNFRPSPFATVVAGLMLLMSSSVSAQAGANAAATPPAPVVAATAPHVTPPGHMIAEIQVIPRPVGTAQNRYQYVDAAIAVIQSSGLRYEVHGLGTVVEGPPEKVWALLQAVHQATLEAGAERTLSVIKVSSGAQAGGPRVEDLVKKFR